MVKQFMWDIRMENILKDEAVKCSEVVKEFTESDVLAVYESECRDMDNDIKVRALFDAAVEACGKWLRQVVTADIFDHTKHNTARVSLIVPDGSITVNADASTNYEVNDIFGTERNEVLYTPLGEMDYFTRLAILTVPDNPVQLLYTYLSDCIKYIHHVLCMPIKEEECGGDGFLDEVRLSLGSIQDPLGLHRYDSLWSSGVDEFFNHWEE